MILAPGPLSAIISVLPPPTSSDVIVIVLAEVFPTADTLNKELLLIASTILL